MVKNYKQKILFVACFLLLTSVSWANTVPSDPLRALKEGNQRFVNNTPLHEKQTYKQRAALALGQEPFVTIVACSDSRVPPENIFDQNPGSLFVVRVAGNTVDGLTLASTEFGLSVLETPLLVIMGHEACGAVRAAFNIENSSLSPQLTALLKQIEPAVKQAIKDNPDKTQQQLLDIAIKNNVFQTKDFILKNIPEVNKRIQEGKLKVATAVFNIESGEVVWLDNPK